MKLTKGEKAMLELMFSNESRGVYLDRYGSKTSRIRNSLQSKGLIRQRWKVMTSAWREWWELTDLGVSAVMDRHYNDEHPDQWTGCKYYDDATMTHDDAACAAHVGCMHQGGVCPGDVCYLDR